MCARVYVCKGVCVQWSVREGAKGCGCLRGSLRKWVWVLLLYTSLSVFSHHQALEEALNLHPPAATQQPPGQGNHGDPASNLKKQELLTQIAVLKEQVRGEDIFQMHTLSHVCPAHRTPAQLWVCFGSLHSR